MKKMMTMVSIGYLSESCWLVCTAAAAPLETCVNFSYLPIITSEGKRVASGIITATMALAWWRDSNSCIKNL